jgi:hypothetical protein
MSPYLEIYNDLKSVENIEKLIEYLYNLDFIFIHINTLTHLSKEEKYPFNPNFLSHNYQYLVRRKNKPKNPLEQKYDFLLMIGVDLLRKRHGITFIWKGKLWRMHSHYWDKVEFNMKQKKKLMRFPFYMTIEQRKRWRYLHNKILKGKTLYDNHDEHLYYTNLETIKNMNHEIKNRF